MKVKKQFLNEESLSKYGFRKEPYWYIYQAPDSQVVIMADNGEVMVCCWDEAYLDDVIYNLIVDGLIEKCSHNFWGKGNSNEQ